MYTIMFHVIYFFSSMSFHVSTLTALVHLMNNQVSTKHCPAAQGSIHCGSCRHNVTTESSVKESLVSS